MGRPLNKKYFGNRNIGSLSTTTDNQIGGEGIAGITVTAPGNYINRLPTFATFSGPSEPTGVQAIGILHSVAQSAGPAARGTGYRVGDILTDRNGSIWRVTKLEVATATLDPSHQGTGYGGNDTIPYANGININLDGVDGSGVPSGAYNFTEGGATRGSWTTIGAGPSNTGAQTPSGLGGSGARWNLTWGIKELAFVSSADYAYGTSYYYATDNTVSGSTGTTAALNVGFSPDHLVVTEKGSGYIGTETITFTTTSGGGETTATGTLVLTTDSTTQTGAQGNANNQENAILAYAKTASTGTVKLADIQKQEGSRRYRVITADGTAICNLTTGTTSLAVNQMYILATDANSSTYYVKKLTAHRATLWQKTMGTSFAYANNDVAKWSFATATTGTVSIANA
jgi:hypothetical protein